MSFDRVWSVAFVDGEPKVLFVGRESGVLEKYNASATDGAPLLRLEGHAAAVTGISAASADEVTTCSVDHSVRQWNTAAEVEGRRDGKKTDLGAALRCMVASGESTYVGTSAGDIVKVDAGAESARLRGHRDAVVALAVGDASLFSGSYDFTVRAWDLAAGTLQFIFTGHTNQVKSLAVQGTTVFSVARDDALLMWNVPAEGGEAPPPPEEGEEGKADAPAPPVAATPEVLPAAVVQLPATPHAVAFAGSQLLIGCSDCAVRGVGSKALLKAVADYNATNERSCDAAARKIAQNAAVASTNAKRVAKKKIQAKKRSLLAEAAAAAPPPAAPAAAEDGEEAAAEEEEAPAGPALTTEQEQQLQEFTEGVNGELEGQLAAIEADRARKTDALAPLKTQTFQHARDHFISSPFCSTVAKQSDAAVAMAIDGNTAYVAAGGTVAPAPLRVGVAAL